MRRLIKAALARFRTDPSRACGPAILMYHSIGNNTAGFTVTPAEFRKQMAALREAGIPVVSLDECVRRGKAGDASPAVAITFDDGYRDFEENACPALREHGFTATVFLVTTLVGGTFRTSKGLEFPLMSWDDVRRLQKEGFAFGSHTATHPKLSRLEKKDARRELAESSETMKRELGGSGPLYLCYPHGAFVKATTRIAREEGYAGALTIDPGRVGPKTDPFALPRIDVNAKTTVESFRASLLEGKTRKAASY
ncbi:MAG: polysaccharide deacetylase family protein [Planctomycetota bacterium]